MRIAHHDETKDSEDSHEDASLLAKCQCVDLHKRLRRAQAENRVEVGCAEQE